jgi:predicted transposase YbfD/YdcC|tara:strand:- start:10 stop:384 length:375 start_codon:yes stop_codon:yes gene_type:complete
MNLKLNKYLLMKNNLQLILNTMIPGDSYMPCFTKAVKVETIIKKLNEGKFLLDLKKKQINLNKKVNWDNCVKILGNDILEAYFTSNSVIRALNLRKKNYLRNVKKESIIKLLKKVKYTKKNFRK